MKNHQKGFTVIHWVLISVVVVLIAGAGWLVWKSRQDQKSASTAQTTTINSFAECVAAGNPVMESYPEQCAANGTTFTNPDQKDKEPIAESDPTTTWLLYESSEKNYKVRIPDGWKLVSLNNNIYGREYDAITYKQGTLATVTPTEGGWDGSGPFALIDPKAYYTEIVKEGTKVGTVTTKSGLTAEKYVYVQETEPEAIGYTKGAKVYNYYFGADGKYIQVQHVVNPGATDQSELVEQMIATLQV